MDSTSRGPKRRGRGQSSGPARFAPSVSRSDTELLELVQRQTFRYFWEFAHPRSGLARDRSAPASNQGLDTVVPGGSGFGLMAIIVAAERNWITRQEALD